MSICHIVAEQGLIDLGYLPQQQKSQRAKEIKNKILKQTHDEKLAENFEPITKKIEEMVKCTKKLRKVLKY